MFWNKERLSLVQEMVFLYLRQYKCWILRGIALCKDISVYYNTPPHELAGIFFCISCYPVYVLGMYRHLKLYAKKKSLIRSQRCAD